MSFTIRGLLRFKRRRRVAIAESGEQNLYDFAHNKTHTLYATYHPPPPSPPHCRRMPQSSWHVVQVVVVFYFGLCALYTNRRGLAYYESECDRDRDELSDQTRPDPTKEDSTRWHGRPLNGHPNEPTTATDGNAPITPIPQNDSTHVARVLRLECDNEC